MLIAGTSCVDYSTLNTNRQDIEAQGESGRTFRGMMGWVKRHRPAIVVIENVCSAPWGKVKNYFEEANYSAAHSRFDTKNYYIPHTRMRGYLFAVRGKLSNASERWIDLVKKLERPCSAPYDAFLLATDDPRIQIGREKLVKEEASRGKSHEWAKCETRHSRARLDEKLGNRRPLTNWNESKLRGFFLLISQLTILNQMGPAKCTISLGSTGRTRKLIESGISSIFLSSERHQRVRMLRTRGRFKHFSGSHCVLTVQLVVFCGIFPRMLIGR